MASPTTSPPDYASASHLPTPTSEQQLAAFWKMHELAGEQDIINKYLGTRFVEDLEYVNTNDMRTVAFRTWADHTITVVAKNRLVQAIEAYASRALPVAADAV